MALHTYFLLSDIHEKVTIKVSSLHGYVNPASLLQEASNAFSPVSMGSDVEMYVTCHIYSGGSVLGLPSSTTYRCFPSQKSILWDEWLTFPVRYRDLSPTSRLVFTVWGVQHPLPLPPRLLSAISNVTLSSYAPSSGSSSLPAAALIPGTYASSENLPEDSENGMNPVEMKSYYANLNYQGGGLVSGQSMAVNLDRAISASSSSSSASSSASSSSASSSSSSSPFVSSKVFAIGGTSIPLFNKKGMLKLGRRRLHLWPGVEGDGSIQSATPHKIDKSTGVARLEKIIRGYDRKDFPSVPWLDKLSAKRIDVLQTAEEQDGCSREGRMHLVIATPPFKHPVVFHQKVTSGALPEILPFSERDRLFVLHDPEMNRENPIDNMVHKLTRHNNKLADRELKPKIAERKAIESIISNPEKKLNGEQKELLWRFRYALTDDKRALTKFLRAVDWNDANETKEALEVMNAWKAVIDIADALELLSSYFQNEDVRIYAVNQLHRADDEEFQGYLLQLVQALRYEAKYPSYLSDFLISRGAQSFPICNLLHWYLTVEENDKNKGGMFAQLHADFLQAVKGMDQKEQREWKIELDREGELIRQLIELGNNARKVGGNVTKKISQLRSLLKGDMHYLTKFSNPVKLAVRPDVDVTGILGDKSTMFTSKLTPLLLGFSTPGGEMIRTIFKSGDDLRQDQLIIQMINLMDHLMKKVKLDLCLTPYRVLATGIDTGFVEFVPNSSTVQDVLAKYSNDIFQYLRQHNAKPAALQRALETFVKSTAGYCVITYLLGIGDRHLENVLITTSGHLFHIDFGYTFGRDPKPLPPPMKFCKEMIDAMGGSNSTSYGDFRRYAALAFHILRQHASLILNLLSLMVDANIPDLSADAEKNLLKVREKFRLDLSDEEADKYILDLIDESSRALFPQMVEKIHQWAVYWKN